MWRKGRKGREKLGMITYIRIFRRNVCNVLLPFGKEDLLMGALGVFGVGWGRILQGLNWYELNAWRNKCTALHGMGLGFMHSIAVRSGIKIS
jgi:hypothetical protein